MLMNYLKKYYKLSRERSIQGHLSTGRQLFEMTLLYFLKKIPPGCYHSAHMWKKDKNWKYKFGWLSYSNYRKRLNQYNPRPYQKISMNKLSEKALLSLFNVQTPEFYGWLHSDYGRDMHGRTLCNVSDLSRLLLEQEIDKFCIKRLEGCGGKGFHALEVIKNEKDLAVRGLFSKQIISIADYFNSIHHPDEGLILESYISQHKIMSGLNPSSVNTVRAFVVCPFGKRPLLKGAMVRIGGTGSLVDNTSSGGLASVVNIMTGEISYAQYKPSDLEKYEKHPDHGAQIMGTIIPFWPQVIKTVESTLPLFPHVHFAGFDVAISDNGPVVLELNLEPSNLGLMRIEMNMDEIIPARFQ